jgi:hypothetical protein
MNDPRLADMRMEDDAVGVREAAQGSPDFFDWNAEPLGYLVRIRNAPGRQQRVYVSIVDRYFDVGRHFSSLTPQRQPGQP